MPSFKFLGKGCQPERESDGFGLLSLSERTDRTQAALIAVKRGIVNH